MASPTKPCDKCKDGKIKKLEAELQQAIGLLRSIYYRGSGYGGIYTHNLTMYKLKDIANFCEKKR